MNKGKKIKRSDTNKLIKTMLITVILVTILMATTIVAFADAKDAVGTLADEIFGIVKVVGVVVGLFGIITLGMSISSHDATQRVGGLMLLAGGALVFFAQDLLETMGLTY